MKILVLSHISELVGGAEKSLLDVLDQWSENYKVKPEFILRNPVGTFGVALKKRGWKYHSLDYTFWSEANPPTTQEAVARASLKNTKTVVEIEQIIKKTKPDIVLTNSVVCPWAALAAHHQEVPHVWFVREYGDLDHGRVFEIGRKKTWEDVGNLSALVVANSQALASHVKKYINGDKVTVLYNPFSLEDISKKASENVPNPYKHKDSLKLILTSGSLTTSKGVAEAVEATAVLNKEGFLAELCLVGREDNKEYLRSINKTIKECGIVDKVHFTGWQKNPLAYVKYADAGIMSSRREAFGRVTFEYIAIGKPVIGTNAGGTPELVRNGVNGFLFERGDTASLVGCLRKYAEDTGLAKTHGQNSLKRAKEIISSQYNADNTYKKLKSITSKKQKYSDNIHYETKLTDYGKLSKEAGKRRLLKTTKQALRSKAGAVYRFSRSTARKALKERKYVKR